MNNNWNFSVIKKGFSSEKDNPEFLRRSKYLSEYKSEEEKNTVKSNLDIDKIYHRIISKEEFDLIIELDKNTIYFVTE